MEQMNALFERRSMVNICNLDTSSRLANSSEGTVYRHLAQME